MRTKKSDSEHKLDEIEKERSMKVYKADELLQKARFNLSLTEQRIILYSISKIKPTDNVFQEYVFELKHFYSLCGINGKESYNEIKKTLEELRKKTWWITMEDPHSPGTECESLVNWFTVLRTNKSTGKVTVKFHDDMFPYLLELSRRMEEERHYFTAYEFRYVLPMKSTYSIRLYELLKSYQKNNQEWWFKLEKLKHILDCENYKRYADFRRYVLEPAVREINQYSDLNIGYEIEKDGKKIDIITFYMTEKDNLNKIQAQKTGLTELDGNIHYWDINGQMSFDEDGKEKKKKK